MSFEFDHLFICTQFGAPEVAALVAFGLTEGTSNSHPGQGTTNRRIFFHNAMLEFLWVIDEQEVQSPVIAPTQLWERWQYQTTGYSPFGIALRRRAAQEMLSTTWEFETWPYRPPYLPPELEISVASNTSATEPMLFIIPFGGRQDALPSEQRQRLDHAVAFREITAISIIMPSEGPLSPAMETLQMAGIITFGNGDEHCAEIEFDHGTQGQAADFRPALPLRFRW